MEELQSLNRRDFIKKISALSTLAAFSVPVFATAQDIKITLLHTNDVHSRIEPFPMNGSRYQGLGGVARRSTLIDRIRGQEKNVLLVDAGDMFQGTPYFNMFDGKLELELMSKLKYDVGTLGNHEFDNGIPGLLKHFDCARFPFVTSNYDLTETALAGKTKEYVVLQKQGIRIGIFGLCKDLTGLAAPPSYKGLKYLDPLEVAHNVTNKLKNELKCDMIICLSHLGYTYPEKEIISDLIVAANTKNIDVIIGGHTHTLLDKPVEIKNLDGKITLINQVGYGGAYLGRIDFIFDKSKKLKRTTAFQYDINKHLDHAVV